MVELGRLWVALEVRRLRLVVARALGGIDGDSAVRQLVQAKGDLTIEDGEAVTGLEGPLDLDLARKVAPRTLSPPPARET